MRRTVYGWLIVLFLLSSCGVQSPATQAPTTVPVTPTAAAAPTTQVLSPTLAATVPPTSMPTPVPMTPTTQENQTTPVVATKIMIPMEGDVQLAGTLYGQGTTAVVFAHQLNGSQAQWSTFAADVARGGFTAVTFDFRGHGATGGERHLGELDQDIKVVFTFLAGRGITKIVCVGASAGGTACLKAAHEPNIVGLVIVSSPLSVQQPLSLRPDDFAGLMYPKLFVVSENDLDFSSGVEAMYKISPEPKQLKVFPGSAHGTDLLGPATHDEFEKLLIDFLNQLR